MTDLVSARPQDSLHFRNIFSTPVPANWTDHAEFKHRVIYPNVKGIDREDFTPQWMYYFPIEFGTDTSPKDAANLIYEMAPDVVLVELFQTGGWSYALAAHAVGTNNLWPFLIAHVCCGAVPPVYLAERIELGGVPQQGDTRKVEAVMNALIALRRYMAEVTQGIAAKCHTVEIVLTRREGGCAEIG